MATIEQDLPFSSDQCLKKSVIDFGRKHFGTKIRRGLAILATGVIMGIPVGGASIASESVPVTPIPRSELKPNAPQSEYILLFNEVASDKATQNQIRQYNDLVRAEITIPNASQKDGLIAIPCVVDTGKKDNPEDFRSGIGYMDKSNVLVSCVAK